jgi:hypothetical protein
MKRPFLEDLHIVFKGDSLWEKRGVLFEKIPIRLYRRNKSPIKGKNAPYKNE